jgi:VanZ family protein
MKKNRLFALLALLFIILLTYSSSQSADVSNSYSMPIATFFYDRLKWLFNLTVVSNGTESILIVEDMVLAINLVGRKIVHFIVFSITTYCVAKASDEVPMKSLLRYICIFIFMLVIASLDEFHQLFTHRNASIFDVCIDMSGVSIVIACDSFINRRSTVKFKNL